MNNTHFAICNTDNAAFAVIRKGDRSIEEIIEALKTAIQEETGEEVERVVLDGLNLENINIDGYNFEAIMQEGCNLTHYIYPTWEY
jgi:hypothetical protein